MMREADLFTVIVEDNGVGFDLELVDKRYASGDSLGLINLRERSELVNGFLEIDTFPGKGTKISLTIPITEEAAEDLQKPGFATQDIPFEEANLPN
jgi:two-component system sensor histidine kinase DegS